jgi:tetratricopeptide (TPR) repeat protein
MDNNEYIDSYFREEHSAAATAAFDEKVKQDPAFAEAVAFYCSTMQIAKNQLAAEKKQHFREIYAQTGPSAAPPAPVIRRWWPAVAAAAIVVGLVVGLYLYMQPTASLQQMADRYIKDKLATTMGVSMGAKEDSIGRAMQYYNDNKLPEALVAFETIARANTESDVAKKMAGVVSLRLGDYDKAINYFTQLEEQRALYDNPGKLYHTLALIKRNRPGDKEAAKLLLQQVAEQQPAYQETAKEWLKAF